MTDQPRRFPASWTVEEYRGISYIVRDANNFAVAYIYFEAEPSRRAAAQLMTKDEARKMRTASPNFLICSAPLSEKTPTALVQRTNSAACRFTSSECPHTADFTKRDGGRRY